MEVGGNPRGGNPWKLRTVVEGRYKSVEIILDVSGNCVEEYGSL